MADFAVPAGCLTCGAWIPGGLAAPLLCGRCRTRLSSAPWPRCSRCHFPRGTGRAREETCRACGEWPQALTAARYAHVLRVPASDVVHALKYEGWFELGETMGASLRQAYVPADHASAVVTYVPTTESRLRQRGYNQAEVLARAYAVSCGLSLTPMLVRRGATASQTTLHAAERMVNVAGAFHPTPEAVVRGRGADVVLVDDVLTTGATASAAAEALESVGVRSVTLLTYARALPSLKRDAA